MIWQLQGTEEQQELVRAALRRTTFPFDVMLSSLKAQTGRDYIPVEWVDLSRYGQKLEEAAKSGSHLHVHEGEDTGDPIMREVEGRQRVLGLAWYSGKVTLDLGLETDPEVAAEVFLSEGAHMMDFFWMEDRYRIMIWNALHPDEQDLDINTPVTDGIDLGHGHGWFDVDSYRSWVGEAWMGLFVRAYSDFPVTIGFDHPPTKEAIREVRHTLTPYFGVDGSHIYHDRHRKIKPDIFFVDRPNDRRPCGVCKP